MKSTPILFNTDMVHALLQGTKTQTRRIVDFAKIHKNLGFEIAGTEINYELEKCTLTSPYGKAGDELWVRETWSHDCYPYPVSSNPHYFYREDFIGDPLGIDLEHSKDGIRRKWLPSIFMPRAACRITLKITNIRAEKLKDISQADAIAEGIEPNWIGDLKKGPNGFGGQGWTPENGWFHYLNSVDGEEAYTPVESYQSLWESMNGRGSWHLNLWVWVIEFEVIS